MSGTSVCRSTTTPLDRMVDSTAKSSKFHQLAWPIRRTDRLQPQAGWFVPNDTAGEMGKMNSTGGRTRAWQGILGLGLCLATGCQTWVGGMTLPSPRYLNHPPQYFAPSPAFPLTKELSSQEAIAAAPASAAAGLPAPVATPNVGGPLPQ